MLTQFGRENSNSAVFSLYCASLRLRLFSNRFCIQGMKIPALNVCSALGSTNFCHISVSLWNDLILSPESFEPLRGGKCRWGLSGTREVLYNKHPSKLIQQCHKCTMQKLTKIMSNIQTQTHMQHCQSWGACSLRGPVCILSEGHAEKDRWWCTTDFNGQATPRFPPQLLYTQPKSKVAQNNRSGVVVGRLQWGSLASWQQLKWELKK